MAESPEAPRSITEILSDLDEATAGPTIGKLRAELEASARAGVTEGPSVAADTRPDFELDGVSERRQRFWTQMLAYQNAANPTDAGLKTIMARADLLWETFVALCKSNPDAAMHAKNRDLEREVVEVKRELSSARAKLIQQSEEIDALKREREAIAT